jgi:hypothetical protein
MFQLAPRILSTDECQLYGSFCIDETYLFLSLVTKMSNWFLEQWLNIKFCMKLSLELKHCAFNIVKANDKVFSGNSWHLNDPGKLAYQNQNWRQCSLLSSVSRVLFTLNSFLKAKQSIKFIYVEVLKQLCEAVHRRRPELWPSDWILHHDNAVACKALTVKQFLAQRSITEM